MIGRFLTFIRFSHTVFALPFALGSMCAAARGLPSFRTVGLMLLLVGHVAFLINFVWIACPFFSQGTSPAQFRNPPALEVVKA